MVCNKMTMFEGNMKAPETWIEPIQKDGIICIIVCTLINNRVCTVTKHYQLKKQVMLFILSDLRYDR